MFMGPWDQGGPWSSTGIGGVSRFLNRVWTVVLDPSGTEAGDPDAGRLPPGASAADAERALLVAAHRTLKVVTGEFEGYRFNTMVAHLMELTNVLMRYRGTEAAGGLAWNRAVDLLLHMLAPSAPHISEELWARLLESRCEPWHSIHVEAWPAWDEDLVAEDLVELPVQVNGKLRDRIQVPPGLSPAEIERIVLEREKIRAILGDRPPDRVIQVAGRLVNVVVR